MPADPELGRKTLRIKALRHAALTCDDAQNRRSGDG
jgi:hypothetical protein